MINKIIPSLFFSILISFNLHSQYQDFHIKEQFDKLYLEGIAYGNRQYEGYEHFTFSTEPTNGIGYYLASSWVQALDGLLTMYETTKDKAYLYAFMKESTKIIESRRDKIGLSNHPIWFKYQNSNETYDHNGNGVLEAFNGRILMFLARFYYIVKSDYYLGQTSIELYNGENRLTLYKDKLTFSSYANYVGTTVKETLNWVSAPSTDHNKIGKTNMWHTDQCDGKYEGISHAFANRKLGPFNYQAPWAMAYLYMYRTDASLYEYGVKAVKIAKLIFGWNCNNNGGHLKYYSTSNSYWWNHTPWRAAPNNVVEDIGHGTWDIKFALLYNKHKSFMSNVTTIKYFEDYHLARFRNTFTKNMWETNYQCCGNQTFQGFHIGINGKSKDDVILDGKFNNYPFDSYLTRAYSLEYMPLYKFDNYNSSTTPPNAYNILMDLYNTDFKDRIDAAASINTEGKMSGWADMVNAHWDKECYDLYLNNRDCYFDQDFYAKGDLYIGYENPPYESDYTMLKNTLNPSKKIIIRNGTTINVKAHGQVYINWDNVVVESGGAFNVTSEYTENCSPLYEEKPTEKQLIINNENSSSNITIFPNPIEDILNIQLGNLENVSVKIISTKGKVLHIENNINTPLYQLKTNLTAGLYLVEVKSDKEAKQFKIIKK